MIIQIGPIEDSTYQNIRDLFDDGIRSFEFIIDSPGGNLDSAFRIYDLLRGDETCVVSAKVDGMCASAATVLLLTAPLERRTATMHSTFLCHSPMLDYVGTINKQSAEELSNTINSAYEQLKTIYINRTTSEPVIDAYMQNEKLFYSDEALKLGFIGNIEKLYNKVNKMSKIKKLIASIIAQLKNETFVTKDGITFEAMSLEVGVPVDGLDDGVFELEDGTVITVEQGIIVDVIPPVAEPEPEAVKNEEPETTEPVEEKKDDVVETVEQVAEQVEEATSEEEIKQIVEEAIQELKVELENKYQPMCKLVNELGGVERLKALKNAKGETKNFVSEKPADKKKLSLEELMNKVRK